MISFRTARSRLLVLTLSGSASIVAAKPFEDRPLRQTLDTEAKAGTGGIGITSEGSPRLPARPDLPTVTPTADGFEIKTAKGQSFVYPSGRLMEDRFFALWWDMHRPASGYFSPLDIPFHTAETLIVEAPDYGHVTTSEGFSYWAWLEAMYARYTGDFSLLHYVYDRIETYAIPSHQPTIGAYKSSAPAAYAQENPLPTQYPSLIDSSVRIGSDPLAAELQSAYGPGVYGMHWLIDTSNWYGFGQGQEPTFINTFQRGAQESVWETIPHPSIEEFKFGAPNQGYLSLFSLDYAGYKQQWRYTDAPDADARLVQATYWARAFALEHNDASAVDDLVSKASKMGDYLRYAMFDKYFKKIGCQNVQCPAGKDYDSAHYLLSWYYAWGGSEPSEGNGSGGAWSWRIGGSHTHFGYQNPLAAFALSKEASFRPKTKQGQGDWQQSLQRQIELYRWLQASNGAIAGGATSSWEGRYATYPQSKSTFYGMAFDANPVYQDPGSNTWFGWQAWSMQRVAEYYAESGDAQVEPLLDAWVAWVRSEVHLLPDQGYEIPVTLAWTGEPATWNPAAPEPNSGLFVQVSEYNQDVGIAAALAKTLMYYAAGSARHRLIDQSEAKVLSRELMDRIWNQHRDDKGLSVAEVRKDYSRFKDPVYVPDGYRGRMPHGEAIDANATFLSLRSRYTADPDYPRVEAFIQGGPAPVFHYHRFWAQVEAALAYAEYDRLFKH